VSYCNNVFILHQFRYITTFTVYVTGCDLENSFNLDKTVETDYKPRELSDHHVRTVTSELLVFCF